MVVVGETLRGDVPEMLSPGMTWDDLDQMNEQTYLENRDKPLAEVLSEFHTWSCSPGQSPNANRACLDREGFCQSRPILPETYSPGPQRYPPNILPREDVFFCLISYN